MDKAALDENVYVSHSNRRHVKIREIGYDMYGYIQDDGRFGFCCGFVGPEARWKTVGPSLQTKEDIKFREDVEEAWRIASKKSGV